MIGKNGVKVVVWLGSGFYELIFFDGWVWFGCDYFFVMVEIVSGDVVM